MSIAQSRKNGKSKWGSKSEAQETKIPAEEAAEIEPFARNAAKEGMEVLHDSGRTRLLGVSNMTFEQLQSLCEKARIRPRFVQNRCYAVRQWDRLIREFCAANDIIYKGFSLLTGNRDVMASPELAQIAKRHGRTVSQIVFRFALDVGMLPLTGTTDADHMRLDLDLFDFRLEPAELQMIERLASP